jgi:hypothetical protein
MQSTTHVYEVLLAIARVPSYIPGDARSFWEAHWVAATSPRVSYRVVADLAITPMGSLRRRFAENDMHAYEIRPRKDHRGVKRSGAKTLPHSMQHGNVTEMHEHKGQFKEPVTFFREMRTFVLD